MATETLQPPLAEQSPAIAAPEKQTTPEGEGNITLRDVSEEAYKAIKDGATIEQVIANLPQSKDGAILSIAQSKAIVEYLANDGEIDPSQLEAAGFQKAVDLIGKIDPKTEEDSMKILQAGLAKHLAEKFPNLVTISSALKTDQEVKTFMDEEVPEGEEVPSIVDKVGEVETFIARSEKEASAPKKAEDIKTAAQFREALLASERTRGEEFTPGEVIVKAENFIVNTKNENLKKLAAEVIAEEKLKIAQESTAEKAPLEEPFMTMDVPKKERPASFMDDAAEEEVLSEDEVVDTSIDESEFEDIGIAAPPTPEESVPSVNKVVEGAQKKIAEEVKAEAGFDDVGIAAPPTLEESVPSVNKVVEEAQEKRSAEEGPDDEVNIEAETKIEKIPDSLGLDLQTMVSYFKLSEDMPKTDEFSNIGAYDPDQLKLESQVSATNMIMNQIINLYNTGGPDGKALGDSKEWSTDTKKKLVALVQAAEQRNPLKADPNGQSTQNINKLKQTLGME